jgi:hypothetical protein
MEGGRGGRVQDTRTFAWLLLDEIGGGLIISNSRARRVLRPATRLLSFFCLSLSFVCI